MSVNENDTPQLENGYTRIATELVEHFCMLHLSGNEWQIVWVVIRKTYGWGKKEDSISLTKFQELTGLSRPSVQEALNKLVGKKVLCVNKDQYINSYAFNKLHSSWIVPKRELVGFSVQDSREKPTRVVGEKVLKLVGKKEHTIDKINTNTKDTIQKIVVPYSKIEDLQDSDLEEIAQRYSVPLSFVKSKAEDMYLWANEKAGRGKGRNWRLTLMNWVKRDALKIKSQSYGKSKISVVERD